MKNSNALTAVICIGILIVLGCSCPSMAEIQKEIEKAEKKATPTPSSSPGSSPSSSPSKGSGSSAKVTLAQYNDVKTGMTYDEVIEKLGGEGEEISTTEVGSYSTGVYKWDGDGEDYASVTLIFQNKKLISKSQYGLK